MTKKAAVFALVISLLLVLLAPGLGQAQGELKILENSALAEFPLELRFNLAAESDADITDIRLHYTVDRESYAQVTSEVYIEFVPATTVDVQWTWDMRKTGGLPPGTGVDYWWTVKNANGNKKATAPLRAQFDDKRYSWQSLTAGKVTLYWYEGRQSFAEQLMSATQQALARLAEDTGAYPQKPVKLYIYANSRDLQGAMIFPQEWSGGVSFTRYDTVAIGIAPNNLSWGKRAIAHELTHLIVHQMTSNPYSELPSWLAEGLAVYSEGELSSQFKDWLDLGVAQDSLISVRSLSSPFSALAENTYLAYAQSYSLVEFLITSYGQGKMLELLNTFKEGNSDDRALAKVYRFDTDGLDTLWRDYITMQYHEAKTTAATISPVSIGISTNPVSELFRDLP